MLRHQKNGIVSHGHRANFPATYQDSLDPLEQDSKHHSPSCDDSGVFLEETVVSSPETTQKSALCRLQSITLQKFSPEDTSQMRQYSIPEALDSDAERSDDLGLASSSIDSADDLDGDPLPSTLQICPPTVPMRQKPPPVPARKTLPKSVDSQKHGKFCLNEKMTIEVPNTRKMPLSKSSSSGEDSNFGEGDIYMNEDDSMSVDLDENSKNVLNQHKNDQSIINYAISRSFHEEAQLNAQRENNPSQESKTNFLARTLSSSSPTKKLDVLGSAPTMKMSDHSSSLKWKSEECLRTAAESKWSLPGRRYEKSVSVKDRIAMFSEMEANQGTAKRDLQRYGSENNIKSVAVVSECKKPDISVTDDRKQNCLSRDTKWQSLHNISKKYPEKEQLYTSVSMKPAISIPILASSPASDNLNNSCFAPFPIKLEVEPPKPIVSIYPETQLTNNKRYNYGLYSLKNLKNTEDLLSKKAAGSNLLSIIDSRKQPLRKLKGLVIPEKPLQPDASKALPVLFSSDSDSGKETRRGSLPITVVTSCKTMSLPRNNKTDYPLVQKQASLTEPPWKNERNTNSSSTLPKYSPAFKKRSLELPGSSLSPTPPSSLTSPLSPPPSSPSSICSSNASSTLQQNVFQFSLSHSKPVQPLQPEKALMSPPSLPSDVEYEGDNSEDSSHSASPMRCAARGSKDIKSSSLSQGLGILHVEKSNTFTSSAKTVALQPLLVETLVKSSNPVHPQPPPRAAVCISKTEIHLKRDSQKANTTESSPQSVPLKHTDTSEIRIRNTHGFSMNQTNNSFNRDSSRTDSVDSSRAEHRNGICPMDPVFMEGRTVFSNGKTPKQNGSLMCPDPVEDQLDIPVGKFRAFPLNLQEVKPGAVFERGREKTRRPPLFHSECEESEDDDSHSTLSHQTEDSRHTTTDDCLSDATTDSFEKHHLLPEVPSNLRGSNEDYASTEGYLSDVSTDVSLRRFTNRPMDASTEEYLSDATAESPDPDWMANRIPQADLRYSKNYISRSETGAEEERVDLRPKRLSQQKTVLRASVEPSGSVQKFKALAEKWEQRTDVTSPPPPPIAAAPIPKRDPKSNSLAASLFSASTTSTVMKGKGSSLPPSLMPRSAAPERKASSRHRSSPEQLQESKEDTNGWNHESPEDPPKSLRRDSSGSSSGSSKNTLKDEEAPEPLIYESVIPSEMTTPALSNGHRASSLKHQGVDSWNNEPRNRRGADFSRSEWSRGAPSYGTKASVSDIRRSFENGGASEIEKPTLPKQSPLPVARSTATPERVSSVAAPMEDEEVLQMLEEARRQLQLEGVSGHFTVLPVLLRREGTDGGSVGITLAGGADYEVKEITVHKVIGGSIADRDGRVLKGDRVLSINGRDVRGVSHGEALHILKAPNPRVLLVLARSVHLYKSDVGSSMEMKRQSANVQNHRDAETFLVDLLKDATGVGFSIEGGKDSPQGDRPLQIKRVFKGGAADKEGQLEEGDEILTVNGHSVTNMTRTEAWNFLKKLPEGSIRLQIRKTGILLLS